MPYTYFTTEDELAMIQDNYQNDISLNRLQKKYHTSATRIAKIFKKYGLEIRKNIHLGKYSFNKDFFKNENEDLAYFLGWVSSDGFIATNSNVIGIELQASDKLILENLSQAMEYTRPILDLDRPDRGHGHFCKFILENREIKQLLINKYGIIPNKSNNINFCFDFNNLSKQFWKDYIRGYFDGDGSIKMTGKYLTFQIDCTSVKMLLAIENALKELDSSIKLSIVESALDPEKKINSDLAHCKMPVFRLYCYGINAEKVYKILYNDAHLYLKRKYDRYIEYMK